MDGDLYELKAWLCRKLQNELVLDLQTVGGSSIRHHIQKQIARHLADKAIVSHGHNFQFLIEELFLKGNYEPIMPMSDDKLVKILRDMPDRDCIYAITLAIGGQS